MNKIKETNNSIIYESFDKNNVPLIIKQVKNLFNSSLCNEVEILEKLSETSGISKLLYYEYNADDCFLFFEKNKNYIDLFDYITINKKVSEINIKIILKQLINILLRCIDKKIIHGDIKDENIIINTETLEIKLIDFGSAFKYYEDAKIERYMYNNLFSKNPNYIINGTIIHYPPELFLKPGFTYDIPLTVWTIGVLTLVMLTGKDNCKFIRKNEYKLYKYQKIFSSDCFDFFKIMPMS